MYTLALAMKQDKVLSFTVILHPHVLVLAGRSTILLKGTGVMGIHDVHTILLSK